MIVVDSAFIKKHRDLYSVKLYLQTILGIMSNIYRYVFSYSQIPLTFCIDCSTRNAITVSIRLSEKWVSYELVWS